MSASVAQIAPLVSARRLADILGVAPDTLRTVARQGAVYYRPFVQERVRDGVVKKRSIDQPIGLLKFLQGRVNERLLAGIALPAEIRGGVPCATVRSHALPHVGQPEVVTADIRDYFHHVTCHQVAEVFVRHLRSSNEVTWTLTALTTYEGHLPVGAPTSTALGNLVLAPLLSALGVLLDARGLRRGLWVDDVVISGTRARDALNTLAVMLSRQGFSMARGKTSVMPRWVRQALTGTVVNRKVSVGKPKLTAIRTRLLATRGEIDPAISQKLDGRISNAISLCRSQGETLRSLRERRAGTTSPTATSSNG